MEQRALRSVIGVAHWDVREERTHWTISAAVKLAREIDEPSSRDIGQPTAECQLMVWLSRRRLVTWRYELLPVQGGAEGIKERVLAWHTKVCEKGEVTSLEEHGVELVTALWARLACGSTLSRNDVSYGEDRDGD